MKNRVVPFDKGKEESSKNSQASIKSFSKGEEAEGNLKRSSDENKLMHSVLENDKQTMEEGKIIREAYNQGINSFSPQIMFEQLVSSYATAKQLYGESLIRAITGYEPSYIEKNIRIPEFRRELKKQIEQHIKKLRNDKVLSKEFTITDEGIKIASLVTAVEELEHIESRGLLGEKENKRKQYHGDREDYKSYKKGAPYRELAIKQSIKTAIRRNHKSVMIDDVKVFERKAKGKITIVYVIDASGSMRGHKIDASKKAGMALAYKAIREHNDVGVIVFGNEVKDIIHPTNDFMHIIKILIKVRASAKTDIAKALYEGSKLFSSIDQTKHMIIISDALPTSGESPMKNTLEAAAVIASQNITLSVVGINLDKKGENLASQIVNIGKGRMHRVRNIDELDRVVLEDYNAVRSEF